MLSENRIFSRPDHLCGYSGHSIKRHFRLSSERFSKCRILISLTCPLNSPKVRILDRRCQYTLGQALFKGELDV